MFDGGSFGLTSCASVGRWVCLEGGVLRAVAGRTGAVAGEPGQGWVNAELNLQDFDYCLTVFISCSSILPLSNCPQLQCCRHIVPGPLWCS